MVVLGKRGDELIKLFEKFSYTAYLPTPKDVPTIGWGHTHGVKLGQSCTFEQALQWYKEDTAEAIRAVDLLSKKLGPDKLTQSMIDALISLVYNVGASAISSGSTIGAALIDGDYFAAWRGFTLWINQDHKPLLGLARRRGPEMILFLADGIPK